MTPPSAPCGTIRKAGAPVEVGPTQDRWRTCAACAAARGRHDRAQASMSGPLLLYRRRDRKTVPGCGRWGAAHRRRPAETQTIRPVPGCVRCHPRQGHTAAVAPLLALRSGASGRSGIFECSPRNVSHLKKAEFLTLRTRMPSPEAPAQAKGPPARGARRVHGPRHKTTRRDKSQSSAI